MPSNIEIKARVADMQRLRSTTMQLAPEPGQLIHQEDVFFPAASGRLKLRILADDSGELIHYHRPDTCESKQSVYQIVRTSRPQELRRLLSDALGEAITVRKRREIYLVGRTRIHLDEVEGLGSFMELEVVLDPDQDPGEGRRIASELMTALDVSESDLVPCAYADLLARSAG